MSGINDAKGATARLRKTFHYPGDDDDSDSQPEAMDEQEQDSLIQRLKAENESRNASFRLALLALPLLTTIPYLLNNPFSFRSLLALTSLFSTAYILHTQPPHETGIPFLDALVRPAGKNNSTASSQARQRRAAAAAAASPFLQLDDQSPLKIYLPYLNLGLCGVVALMGLAASSKSKADAQYGWIGLGNLPLFVYGVVLVAKMVMGSVDPEAELEALRYEYKGA